MAAMKVLPDSNFYDALREDEQLRSLYDEAQNSGLISLITTHINLDQLNQIQDDAKRASVLSVANAHTTASTFGFVTDVSRLGWATLAPAGALDSILGNQKRSVGNIQDALLASTAANEGAILITEERRLRNKCKELSIAVMNSTEFKVFLADQIRGNADKELGSAPST